jgi:hypothetical protein
MRKEHDVTKLPKWAQDEISRLKANLHDAQKRMNTMIGANSITKSNVMLPYFQQDMQDQYLPRNQRVQFLMPHPWAERRPGYIEVRHHGEDLLDIHASQPIWIEPGASNCLQIRFRSRD